MTSPADEEPDPGGQVGDLRRIAADLERTIASADEVTHDAMCRAGEISTGTPELDSALRGFSRTYAQQVAELGNATDRVIQQLRSAADHLEAVGVGARWRPRCRRAARNVEPRRRRTASNVDPGTAGSRDDRR